MSNFNQKVADLIFENLLQKKSISDEIVKEFIDSVEAECELDEPNFKPFRYLRDYVNNYVQSDEFKNLPRELAFLYGRLWSAVFFIEIREYNIAKNKSIRDGLRYSYDFFDILKTINDNSGISKSDLLTILSSNSRSYSFDCTDEHVINTLISKGYVMSRELGQGTYFYLTALGVELLNAIQEKENMGENKCQVRKP